MSEANQDEASELRARIAAARDKRKALAAAEAPRRELATLTREAELEERGAADDAAIAKAERELGKRNVDWATCDTAIGVVILRRPNGVAFKKFQDTPGKPTTLVLEELVQPCVCHPPVGEWNKALDITPGVLMQAADRVCELAGIRQAEQLGKA